MTQERCKRHVYPIGGSFMGHTCSRKAVRDGYCTQHHPDTEKARTEKSVARWNEKEAAQRAAWEAGQNTLRNEGALAALKKVREEVVGLICDAETEYYRGINVGLDKALQTIDCHISKITP